MESLNKIVKLVMEYTSVSSCSDEIKEKYNLYFDKLSKEQKFFLYCLLKSGEFESWAPLTLWYDECPNGIYFDTYVDGAFMTFEFDVLSAKDLIKYFKEYDAKGEADAFLSQGGTYTEEDRHNFVSKLYSWADVMVGVVEKAEKESIELLKKDFE